MHNTKFFLADTGAAVSAISDQVFEKLPDQIKTPLTRDTLSVLRAVNGQDIPVLGQLELPFSIDNKIYWFKVFVAQDLHYDVVLGKDFLEHFNAIIDLQNNTLTLPELAVITTHTSPTTQLDQLGRPLSCYLY